MRVKTQKKGAPFMYTIISLLCCCARTETAVEEKVSWNYYELFQTVLQAQADAIVKLGFKPIVKVLNTCTVQ